jgi:hypothetical protein
VEGGHALLSMRQMNVSVVVYNAIKVPEHKRLRMVGQRGRHSVLHNHLFGWHQSLLGCD